ncbi:MAG: hypothetical protein WHS77_01970 [Brevinematales bacterium]
MYKKIIIFIVMFFLINGCVNYKSKVLQTKLQNEQIYILLEEGNYKKALEEIDKIIKIRNNKDLNLIIIKSYILYTMEKYDESMSLLKKNVKKDLKDVAIHNKLLYCKMLIETGQMRKSMEIIEDILKEDRDNIIALYYKGIIFKNLGLLSDSLDCFSKVTSYTNIINKSIKEKDELAKTLSK